MPRKSILDMTADEPSEKLPIGTGGGTAGGTAVGDNPFGGELDVVGPAGGGGMENSNKENATFYGASNYDGATLTPKEPPVVGAAMSMGAAGANSAAASLPVSNASFNSGSAVSGINTPDTQGPQVPASTSMQRDSTGNATRDASGNTLGSSYESPESILRMAQGKLGQTNAANLSTNPNPGLNYGVQGASLETAADSGSISNEGAVPQSPIDSLGQTNLDENRAIEVMRMAQNQPTSIFGGANKPAELGPGAGGPPPNAGEVPQDNVVAGNFQRSNQAPAGYVRAGDGDNTDLAAYVRNHNLQFDDNDVSNGVINLRKRYERLGLANRPGYGMDMNGNAAPLAQIDGPLWNPSSGQDYAWAEGAKPTPSVSRGNTTTPGNTTNTPNPWANRSITGTGGVSRQTDAQGRILTGGANGGFQQAEDGSILTVTADGKVMAGTTVWGALDANGKIVRTPGSPNGTSSGPNPWANRSIIGTGGASRRVDAQGRILTGDGPGTPGGGYQQADDGSILTIDPSGKVMAGNRIWGSIGPDGRITRSNTTTPAMDFRGRSIIGTAGVVRQVRADGAILDAEGNPQGDGKGNLLNVTADGTVMAGNQPWGYIRADGQTVKGIRPPDNPGGGAPNTSIATQAGLISPEMLVENRIANLMKSGNPLLEQALTRAKQIANERGTLNSSMTAQAGTEAMLSTARDIASQDANTLKDAALTEYQAKVQQIMQDKSLSSAERENALQREFQRSEGALNRTADVDAREFQARIQQIMQDKSLSSAERENALQREFQRSEGAAQRLFQGDMTREGWRLDSERDTLNYQRNIANFERQIAATKDEGERNFFRTMQQNYNQSILMLQTDPNMTPEQRSAQIAAMNSIFAGFTYNGAFLNMVKPAGSTTTGTGANTGTSGGGSGGGSGGTDSDQK